MKLLIHTSGKEYLVDESRDYHCSHGLIKKKDFENSKVVSNKGEEFYCLDADSFDQYKRLKRGAQIILIKDLGVLVGELGIDKNSSVLDVGTGSAGCCAFLSRFVKKVHSFDKNQRHIDVALKNIEKLGIKNADVKLLDIYNDVPKVKVDAAVIDLLEPWNALPNVCKCLKKGGRVAVYCPHISQNKKLVESLGEGFIHLRTLETIQREWDLSGKLMRPRFGEVVHTAFISIIRKV